MLDFTKCRIKKAAIHYTGNKTNGEELLTSEDSLDLSDTKLEGLLRHFFLHPFSNPEFHAFTFTNGDVSLNPLYHFATELFDHPRKFHASSINIAKHLYELSVHPQIKSGDLFVAHIVDIAIDGELMEAIGIFKSENHQEFLKPDHTNETTISYDDGINIEKLDKGCLIFNDDRENGFKVCIVDRSNKTTEAKFWKDDFLMLKPSNDDYHQTKNFLNITKNFVSKKLTEEFEVSKTDQIDFLNKSVEFFKANDVFDKKTFEKEVFQDANVIKSFRKYDEQYREENDLDIEEQFDISSQAVKKQAKIFKSVLKLDKNFHIYIHGDKDLIESGVDTDGRKFYKIYYKEEK